MSDSGRGDGLCLLVISFGLVESVRLMTEEKIDERVHEG